MVERILRELKKATKYYDKIKGIDAGRPTYRIEGHPTAGVIWLHPLEKLGIILETLRGDAKRERYPGGFKVEVDHVKAQRLLTRLGYKVRKGEFGFDILKNRQVVGDYGVSPNSDFLMEMHRDHAEQLVKVFFGGKTPLVKKKEE